MLSIQSGDVVLQDRQRDEVVHHVDGDDDESLTHVSETEVRMPYNAVFVYMYVMLCV